MYATYTRALRLYPKAFRARFAEEMLRTLRDRLAYEGRIPWARTYADLFGSVATQRWKEHVMKPRFWPVAVTLVVAILIARVAMGAGFSVQMALIVAAEVAFVGLVAGIATFVGRRSRGAEHDYSTSKFRWWWVIAGLIGVTEILMVTGQLINEPKATNVGALFIIGGFAVLVFAGMAIRNRRTGNFMIAAGVAPLCVLFWMILPPIVALFVIVMALSDNVRMARPQAAV